MKVRQRVGALLVAVLMGVGGAVALESPASASSYGPYRIVHSSGYCLEVPNYSYSWGEQLRLNYCGGGDTLYNQFFNFDDAYSAWHYFIRPPYNWYCITPGNVSLLNSTIIQWGCDGGNNSHIWWLGFPNGTNSPDRQLVNNQSGHCLRVDSAYQGAYPVQGYCDGTAMIWRLVQVYP